MKILLTKANKRKNTVAVAVCRCVRLAIVNYFENVIHLRVDCDGSYNTK